MSKVRCKSKFQDGRSGSGGPVSDSVTGYRCVMLPQPGTLPSHHHQHQMKKGHRTFQRVFSYCWGKFGFLFGDLRQNWEKFGQIWKLASVILVGLVSGANLGDS